MGGCLTDIGLPPIGDEVVEAQRYVARPVTENFVTNLPNCRSEGQQVDDAVRSDNTLNQQFLSWYGACLVRAASDRL
ncbi:hypothetical protein MPL3356_270093 [Mesorhizobium plurifarium]|uniref:Uncharacterized protein n=1 Tax=Mesorhizobium plurifarium TaxID=69974 RepID=A0A090FYV7_MESPL|nr:hypothetical protein MPL3356_270093 [Mesorhizobium plurifarium]CDX21023.1 hypothetical protein MPLB_1990049 [Mesorhizobium sp. ORS 3324]CDX52648.1 hypothetical protein MPL3365_170014 [Mesorhizobium plurifarium]